MRILLIGMSESIHIARWVAQLEGCGWDIHLFPSIDIGQVNPLLRNVTVHHGFYGLQHDRQSSIKSRGICVYSRFAVIAGRRFLEKTFPTYRAAQLGKLIDKLKPDIIHSLEIQHAGYLTLEARKRFQGTFPAWIVTNWGSDIYLFGRLPEHESRIREVLATCNYYSCECRRDVCLAKAYGFEGTLLPVFPNTGGFDLAAVEQLRQPGPVSARRLIMLKGYQHWAGRALVGLRALERCVDVLRGYEVAIYSATPDVVLAAELFSRSTGVPVTIMPKDSPHDEILRFHGQARISIGLNISDGISTSLLEAIVMGSFPIQSWTACADEWIEDGKTGMLVPPEDPDLIEKAIRRALADDNLVDRAAELNYRLAEEKLGNEVVRPQVVGIYTTVMKEKGIGDEAR